MAEHRLNWTPGSHGKGLVIGNEYEEPEVHTWNVDSGDDGYPYHASYLQKTFGYTNVGNAVPFNIHKDGTIPYLPGRVADIPIEVDPRLKYNAPWEGDSPWKIAAAHHIGPNDHGKWFILRGQPYIWKTNGSDGEPYHSQFVRNNSLPPLYPENSALGADTNPEYSGIGWIYPGYEVAPAGFGHFKPMAEESAELIQNQLPKRIDPWKLTSQVDRSIVESNTYDSPVNELRLVLAHLHNLYTSEQKESDKKGRPKRCQICYAPLDVKGVCTKDPDHGSHTQDPKALSSRPENDQPKSGFESDTRYSEHRESADPNTTTKDRLLQHFHRYESQDQSFGWDSLEGANDISRSFDTWKVSQGEPDKDSADSVAEASPENIAASQWSIEALADKTAEEQIGPEQHIENSSNHLFNHHIWRMANQDSMDGNNHDDHEYDEPGIGKVSHWDIISEALIEEDEYPSGADNSQEHTNRKSNISHLVGRNRDNCYDDNTKRNEHKDEESSVFRVHSDLQNGDWHIVAQNMQVIESQHPGATQAFGDRRAFWYDDDNQRIYLSKPGGVHADLLNEFRLPLGIGHRAEVGPEGINWMGSDRFLHPHEIASVKNALQQHGVELPNKNIWGFESKTASLPEVVYGQTPGLDVRDSDQQFRRPLLYHEPAHTVYIGQPGTHHADLYDEFYKHMGLHKIPNNPPDEGSWINGEMNLYGGNPHWLPALQERLNTEQGIEYQQPWRLTSGQSSDIFKPSQIGDKSEDELHWSPVQVSMINGPANEEYKSPKANKANRNDPKVGNNDNGIDDHTKNSDNNAQGQQYEDSSSDESLHWHIVADSQHVLNWTPGEIGKGIVADTGEIHTWNVASSLHGPHHNGYAKRKGITPAAYIDLNPDGSGSVWPEEYSDMVQSVLPISKSPWQFESKTASYSEYPGDPSVLQLEDGGEGDPDFGWRTPVIYEPKANRVRIGQPGDYHYDIMSPYGEMPNVEHPYIEGWVAHPNIYQDPEFAEPLQEAPNHGLHMKPHEPVANWEHHKEKIRQAISPHVPEAALDADRQAEGWGWTSKISYDGRTPRSIYRPEGHELGWTKGNPGKALVTVDGKVKTWNTIIDPEDLDLEDDETPNITDDDLWAGRPHHSEVPDASRSRSEYWINHHGIVISPAAQYQTEISYDNDKDLVQSLTLPGYEIRDPWGF